MCLAPRPNRPEFTVEANGQIDPDPIADKKKACCMQAFNLSFWGGANSKYGFKPE
jgi:hypothetical protein